MTIYHGPILSVNPVDAVFSYLVEDGGKILHVGNTLPEQYAGLPVTELGNQALAPAFVDSHIHFAAYALFHAGLNVTGVTSNARILDLVSKFARDHRDKILVGFGVSPHCVEEGRLITREELDRACPDRPFFMVKYDGLACVINSALHRKLAKKLRYKRGYHPETGEMNHEAFFIVSDYVAHSIKHSVLIRDMQKAVDDLASRGIGMIHSASGLGFSMDMDINLETWFARSLQHGFQMRIYPQSLHTQAATSRDLPRIGGCFRCALDGCFGSRDAALSEPYADDPENSGILYYSDELVTDFCKKANRLGLQIEMHAMGDRAFDQAARALKAALADHPRKGHRHGIVHACLPTREGLEICKECHIQMPMQVSFDGWDQEPPTYMEQLLGPERCRMLNPVKTYLDLGCMVSFGSDGPSTEPDPIGWLYRAVNRSNPDQSITIQQALRAATYSGYKTSFDDGRRGSLQPGKTADMVLLSENPYEMPKERLNELKVNRLILNGVPYRNQTQSVKKAILGGMFSKNKA